MDITDGCSVCIYSMCVYIDLRACVRVSQIRVSFKQVFLEKMKGIRDDNGNMGETGEGGGGKKGFVPVNLYGRYFLPGCLSREKHLVQITGKLGKKLKHMMLLLLLKCEVSCLCPLLPAPPVIFFTVSVGFHNMSAAAGQEGYSVESHCYYKCV